jgi:putative ABC transport system permease protein
VDQQLELLQSTLDVLILKAVSLGLRSVGIFGVLSTFVNQRAYEIGVRMALGAKPRQALRLVVGQGLLVALIGIAIGVSAALG